MRGVDHVIVRDQQSRPVDEEPRPGPEFLISLCVLRGRCNTSTVARLTRSIVLSFIVCAVARGGAEARHNIASETTLNFLHVLARIGIPVSCRWSQLPAVFSYMILLRPRSLDVDVTVLDRSVHKGNRTAVFFHTSHIPAIMIPFDVLSCQTVLRTMRRLLLR
jgi:hypothetical protein